MCLCYSLAVLLRTIFNTRNAVPNLERSNMFMGYGIIQSDAGAEGAFDTLDGAIGAGGNGIGK